MLPGLSNWEDYLFITRPEEWSPHAVYAATRIFTSNLNAAMAQRCVWRARVLVRCS
jgi:essential nuclear protein 1